MTTPTTRSIETKPRLDPYHADTGQATRTILWVDLEAETYWVDQAYDDNATPEDVWNGRRLAFPIPGHPHDDDVRKYIAQYGHALIETIIDNTHIMHNANGNRVGNMQPAAHAASNELETDLLGWFNPETGWSLVTADDWIGDTADDGLIDMTDDEIHALGETIETEAEADNTVLIDDAAAYLIRRRAELTEEN